MVSSRHSLTHLQEQVLSAFFDEEGEFFLSGGGALVGFYLHHRHTDDLDLFTEEPDAFERGPYVLSDAAARVGASMVTRQESPGFHRYFLQRGEESVVVDMVLERVPQLYPEKDLRDGVVIDVPREILVNKLTTLVSRAEIRDLVDVMALERAGYSIDDALQGALQKDGGCTPATIAWVLSEVEIPDTAELPGGVEPADLQEYLDDLVQRLRRTAAP